MDDPVKRFWRLYDKADQKENMPGMWAQFEAWCVLTEKEREKALKGIYTRKAEEKRTQC